MREHARRQPEEGQAQQGERQRAADVEQPVLRLRKEVRHEQDHVEEERLLDVEGDKARERGGVHKVGEGEKVQ